MFRFSCFFTHPSSNGYRSSFIIYIEENVFSGRGDHAAAILVVVVGIDVGTVVVVAGSGGGGDGGDNIVCDVFFLRLLSSVYR